MLPALTSPPGTLNLRFAFLHLAVLTDGPGGPGGSGQIKVTMLSSIPFIWVNYNDLTATSLESWLIRGMIPKMALIQVSEIL